MSEPLPYLDLSIVIVSWNTRDLLAQCLQSVLGGIADLDYEIIVVDNASTDGSQAVVREQFPQVRLVENTENLGFAQANNQAIRISQGKYVLLLNSDTIVHAGALEAMVSFANHHPQAGIVGCKLLNADGSLQASWAQFPTLHSEFLGRNFRQRRRVEGAREVYEVDWVGGACLLARRKAVDEVRLLDGDYFMYSEEVDWCYRMAKAGWKTYYLPEAEVTHLGGGSSRKSAGPMAVQLQRSKLRFFRKHYGPSRTLLLRVALLTKYLVKYLVQVMLYLMSGCRSAEGKQLIDRQWVQVRWLAFDREIP